MTPRDLELLLEAVAAGELAPRQAMARLAELPFADLGFAKLDLHRELRLGLPEAVYAEGKTSADLRRIVERLLAAHGRVLVTRLAPAAAAELLAALGGGDLGAPEAAGVPRAPGTSSVPPSPGTGSDPSPPGVGGAPSHAGAAGAPLPAGIGSVASPPAVGGPPPSSRPGAIYHERARVLTCGTPSPASGPPIAVLAAGTSDLPVAEEAAVCAEWFGHPVNRAFDVGVAGLHRLLGRLPEIRGAAVVIAVAGMDGALPTVLAGLVAAPVVAVPTSVGYGASFSGLAPLLTMLNGCAPGVGVVNIDNGFGAAVLASRIARLARAAASPASNADRPPANAASRAER